MDAEALANCEGYAELLAMRASLYEQAGQCAAAVRAKIDALAAGNRHERRRATRELRRLEVLERQSRRRVDQEFEKLARGFDPESGTSTTVQEEAAAELAAIFT